MHMDRTSPGSARDSLHNLNSCASFFRPKLKFGYLNVLCHCRLGGLSGRTERHTRCNLMRFMQINLPKIWIQRISLKQFSYFDIKKQILAARSAVSICRICNGLSELQANLHTLDQKGNAYRSSPTKLIKMSSIHNQIATACASPGFWKLLKSSPELFFHCARSVWHTRKVCSPGLLLSLFQISSETEVLILSNQSSKSSSGILWFVWFFSRLRWISNGTASTSGAKCSSFTYTASEWIGSTRWWTVSNSNSVIWSKSARIATKIALARLWKNERVKMSTRMKVSTRIWSRSTRIWLNTTKRSKMKRTSLARMLAKRTAATNLANLITGLPPTAEVKTRRITQLLPVKLRPSPQCPPWNRSEANASTCVGFAIETSPNPTTCWSTNVSTQTNGRSLVSSRAAASRFDVRII